ncbi:MAG: TonB family protein [Gemmatimonadota bacterium]|nr:TonB family protein [Gemmatimonadota bacterium]
MRLLESKPDNKKRSPGGTIFSIVLHSLILFLAIFATARAGARKADKNREEKVSFVAVKKDVPPPPKKEPPPPKEAPKPKPKAPKVVDLPKLPKEVAPAPPKGFKVLPPPVNIPTTLPAIDLSKAITNEKDFSGKGVAGGSDNGVKGGTGKEGDTGKSAGEADHGPYMEFQVEKPVEKIGGDAPEYPSSLRASGVEGQVLAQFVVNESGRYEGGSLKILNSSNPAFTAAVKDALPRMRFSAAQIGGKKVPQLVQMPFQFHLAK